MHCALYDGDLYFKVPKRDWRIIKVLHITALCEEQAKIFALLPKNLPPKTNLHLHSIKNGAFQHIAPGLKPLQLISELQ